MCHVSLRGLVYFGASVHVYHGAQMLVSTYHTIFLSLPESRSITPPEIIFSLLFLILGCLIFLGVERRSKTLISWPTIAFTLLLAARFVLEVARQVEREASQRRLPPSAVGLDVDPAVSAAVGIYIFVLFVYNHSLEYGPSHNDNNNDSSGSGNVTSRRNRTFAAGIPSPIVPNTIPNPLFDLLGGVNGHDDDVIPLHQSKVDAV